MSFGGAPQDRGHLHADQAPPRAVGTLRAVRAREYELYLAIEDIDHSSTKTKSCDFAQFLQVYAFAHVGEFEVQRFAIDLIALLAAGILNAVVHGHFDPQRGASASIRVYTASRSDRRSAANPAAALCITPSF
jgi:hypothetical protein